MASEFLKVLFLLNRQVLSSPTPLFLKNLANTLSPATLGHHRLCCCLSCCADAVWCWCGANVVVLMVVVLLPHLCKDEALSRTQQARYAVVRVFVIFVADDG